jgi:hypothetical protein
MSGWVSRSDIVHALQHGWLPSFVVPWQRVELTRYSPPKWRSLVVAMSWLVWVVGCMWMIAGLVMGALVAPSFIQFLGLRHPPYRDAGAIALTVLAGLLTHFLLWWWVFLAGIVRDNLPARVRLALAPLMLTSLVAPPSLRIGYGLYRSLR